MESEGGQPMEEELCKAKQQQSWIKYRVRMNEEMGYRNMRETCVLTSVLSIYPSSNQTHGKVLQNSFADIY